MTYRHHHKRFVPQVGPKPLAGLVVDASCIAVQNSLQVDGFFHGAVEWQAHDIASQSTIFASPVYHFGNVNLAELLAIIDGVSLLHNANRIDWMFSVPGWSNMNVSHWAPLPSVSMFLHTRP